jgi:hypothetical protein
MARMSIDDKFELVPITRDEAREFYGACWRAARALGFRRLITYTLPSGGGVAARRRVDARG